MSYRWKITRAGMTRYIDLAESSEVSQVEANLTSHVDNVSNPHGVSAEQVGLGNVLNQEQVPASGGVFNGNIAVPAATAGGHAVNRDAGDARWGQLVVPNTWDEDQSFLEKVAIGKATPGRVLDIEGIAGSDAVRVVTDGVGAETTFTIGWTSGHHATTADVYSDSVNASHRTRRARGTKASPTVVLANDFLGSFTGTGYDGTSFPASSTAAMIMLAADDWSGVSYPTMIDIMTTAVGATSKRRVVRFHSSGQVQLGGGIDADVLFERDGSGSHRIFKNGHFLRILADDGSIVAEFQNNTLGSNMTRFYGRLRFDGILTHGSTTILDASRNLTNIGTGNFSGNVTIPNATADSHAVNRTTGDSRWAQLSGATFTGSIDMGSNNISYSGNLNVGTSGRIYDAVGQMVLRPDEAGTKDLKYNGTHWVIEGDLAVNKQTASYTLDLGGNLGVSGFAEFSGNVTVNSTQISVQNTGSGVAQYAVGDVDNSWLLRYRGDVNEFVIRTGSNNVVRIDDAAPDSSFRILSTGAVDFGGSASFSGNVTIPNASSATHAVNRQTGDGRWAQLTGASFTGQVLINSAEISNSGVDDLVVGTGIYLNNSTADGDTFLGFADEGVWNMRFEANTYTLALEGEGSNNANLSVSGNITAKSKTTIGGGDSDPLTVIRRNNDHASGVAIRIQKYADGTSTLQDYARIVAIPYSSGSSNELGTQDGKLRLSAYINGSINHILAASKDGVDVLHGDLLINGTTAIDSSRNVTFAGGIFSGNISIPNATTSTHAVNRQTGDGRWLRLANLADATSSSSNTAVKYNGTTDSEGVFYGDGGADPNTIWITELIYGGHFKASWLTAMARVEAETFRGAYYSSDNTEGITKSLLFFDNGGSSHDIDIKDGIITRWDN